MIENIYILTTVQYGLDALRLLHPTIPIRGVISLSPRGESDSISGYACPEPFCRDRGIDFIPIQHYALNHPDDRERLLSIPIDALFAIGWQRLVPDCLIGHCRNRVIGIHGSSEGITAGRGRSPQNWALILGKTQFHVSLFWIDPDVDSGSVIDTRRFPLTHYDTIQTSYHKVSLLTAEMLVENWKNGAIEKRIGFPQTGEARYLPQRLPEDGAIDWRRTSEEIYNFIRAQTRPYPGAFSTVSGHTIKIWQAWPFAMEAYPPSIHPGTIQTIFYDGKILVKTGNGSLLVTDYQTEPENKFQLHTGMMLESADFTRQMKIIVERHQAKYPQLPISEEILSLAGIS